MIKKNIGRLAVLLILSVGFYIDCRSQDFVRQWGNGTHGATRVMVHT